MDSNRDESAQGNREQPEVPECPPGYMLMAVPVEWYERIAWYQQQIGAARVLEHLEHANQSRRMNRSAGWDIRPMSYILEIFRAEGGIPLYPSPMPATRSPQEPFFHLEIPKPLEITPESFSKPEPEEQYQAPEELKEQKKERIYSPVDLRLSADRIRKLRALADRLNKPSLKMPSLDMTIYNMFDNAPEYHGTFMVLTPDEVRVVEEYRAAKKDKLNKREEEGS